MTLDEIKSILEAEVIVGNGLLNREIKMICGSDLMSDVLAFTKTASLLLTGLTNPQVVRTAEMADLRAICFVRGKKPTPETVEMAESKSLPLLATALPMFEACGRLYGEGISGCSEYEE